MTLVLIAASITVMVVGTHLVVTGTVSIAGRLGISKRFTGLAIVAVGTLLPEIATTVTDLPPVLVPLVMIVHLPFSSSSILV